MPQFPSFSVWNYSHLLKILIFFRYCHHEDPDFCVHPGSLYRFRDVERWVIINASFVLWFCNCILKLSSLHLTQFRQSYSPLGQTWPGKNPGVKNFTEESSVLLRFRSPTRVRSHDRDYGWKWGLYPCMFFWKKIRLETISQFSILKHFFTLSVSFTSVLRFWQYERIPKDFLLFLWPLKTWSVIRRRHVSQGRVLPSSCTAFPQAFTVNSFQWRMQNERSGKPHYFTRNT